jgi:hypothetical protein
VVPVKKLGLNLSPANHRLLTLEGAMRLADLNPIFLSSGGPGVSDAQGRAVPLREGVGVQFDCPCGCASPCFVAFANPLDGGPAVNGIGPGWKREGTTFEALTLTPSVQRGESCPKRWHGFITNGEVRSC